MTAAPISGTGRRRAITALLAGTAAVLSQGLDALARKRKKKDRCVHCPQAACCSCAPDLGQEPTKCSLVTAASNTDVFNACLAICGQDELFQLFNQTPGFANFCASDHRCSARRCPVKVRR